MKRFGLFALLGLASSSFLSAAVKVGDQAPEIRFDKLLPEQPAANASFKALAGKAVVLEIWATWCAPCVEAIPHLNELAGKFKDRPIVFLSVTDEDPAVVEAFLRKRPISGLVGIAHTESPRKLYGAETIPRTFLIDATGKVAGDTFPPFLNESVLEDLLAVRPLSLPWLPKGMAVSVNRGEEDSGPAPLLDLIVRPSSDKTGSGMRSGRDSFAMKHRPLGSIISSLYEFPPTRMTGQPLDDVTLYDLSFSLPGASPAAFRSLARDWVAAAFHIKVSRETRETDVWILARPDVKPAALAEPAVTGGGSRWWLGNRSVEMTNATMSQLAQALESAAGKPVLDETGIAGRYDFRLTYDPADPQGAVGAMRKLGFKVEPSRRPIEFLVVTKSE